MDIKDLLKDKAEELLGDEVDELNKLLAQMTPAQVVDLVSLLYGVVWPEIKKDRELAREVCVCIWDILTEEKYKDEEIKLENPFVKMEWRAIEE